MWRCVRYAEVALMFQWSLNAMARMPHLRRFDGDLNHVLRAMHEIRKGVDVAIDGALKQLVFDPRINLEHLRVVLQHLIKIILGVELAHPRDRQRSAHHQFFGGLRICSKITHVYSPS